MKTKNLENSLIEQRLLSTSIHLLFLCLLALFKISCASVNDKPKNSDLAGTYYTVKSGDTVSSIAKKSKVSQAEIMDVNGIENDRAIRIGQALFLPDPDPISTTIAKLKPSSSRNEKKRPPVKKTSPKDDHINFLFPVSGGTTIYHFSKAKNKPYDGIGIKAPLGSKVLSAEDGRVLFVGNDGTKFGLLVIIEHIDPYITVYTHLDKTFVKTNQKLKRGEKIGTVGQSGGVLIPHLHFQIRINQRPQNPMQYLSP